MILTKAAKKILTELHQDQKQICKYMGHAKPHLCQINDSQWTLNDNSSLVEKFLTILLGHVTNDIFNEDNCKPLREYIIKILLNTKRFIHICRLLSYLAHETYIPQNGEADCLKLCAFIIANSIQFIASKVLNIGKKCLQKQINNGLLFERYIVGWVKQTTKVCPMILDSYMKQHHERSLLKVHNMLSVYHPRHACLLAKSRYTLQHKPLTALKRKLSSDETLIITKRILHGSRPNSVKDVIQPSVNFVLNLAVIELCFTQATKLSSEDLFSLLTSLKDIPLDVDINYVVSGLTDMARSRLRVKFIEVNKEYCTCHTKCCGYDFSEVLRDEIENKALKRHTTIFCCQRCMLTPLVRNTRARKPRMKICSSNPSLETCSLDNCSTFRDIPLYTVEYKGFGLYKYQHLFYMTNVVNVIEELSGKNATGPSSQLYGMCYGGSRICFTRLKLDIQSSINKKNILTSCHDEERYMCNQCSNKDIYVKDSRKLSTYTYGNDIFDSNTCVNHSLNELENGANVKNVIKKICKGCKMKFLCSHTMLTITRIAVQLMSCDNIRLYKKAIYRIQLVKLVILYLISHDE